MDRFFALAEEKLIDVCIFDIGTLGYTRWRRAMPVLEKAGILAAIIFPVAMLLGVIAFRRHTHRA